MARLKSGEQIENVWKCVCVDEEEENEGCVEMDEERVHDKGCSNLTQCLLCVPCAFPSHQTHFTDSFI